MGAFSTVDALDIFSKRRRIKMSLGLLLLILLVVLVVGSVPTWRYSNGWGYGPSGILGILLLVVIVLLATGRL